LIVVVTTVVEVPDPRVYVRTTESDPLGLATTAAPDTPVERGTTGELTTPAAVLVSETALPLTETPVPRGVEVLTTPAAALVRDAVAEYDARTLEAADSASATGQTV
jgi:hypothetical protein